MQTKAFLARASIIMLAAAPLAGCGGNIMSNYDAEKGRVRGALSQMISCTEALWGAAGKKLECASPDKSLTVHLVARDSTGTSLQIVVLFLTSGGNAETIYPEFRKLMDAYGFEQAEENRCVTEGRYSETGSTHRTACLGRSDAVQVTIDQSRSV